jgi:hypothetical protein
MVINIVFYSVGKLYSLRYNAEIKWVAYWIVDLERMTLLWHLKIRCWSDLPRKS